MSAVSLLRRVGGALRRRVSVKVTSTVRQLGLRPHVESEDRTYWEDRGRRYLREVSSILDPADPYFAAQQDFLDSLRSEAWTSILEVGCGFGWHLRAIAGAFPGRRAVGVDFSLSQLQQGRDYLAGSGAQLAQADAARLPFADDSIDIVFTSGLLMCVHPDRLIDMLRELRRVSRHAVIAMEVAHEHIDSPARRSIALSAGWHCHSYAAALPQAGIRLQHSMAFRSFASSPDRVPFSFFRGVKS
jgi:SAM-dependent methyltransferase